MVLDGKVPYCSDKLNFFNDLIWRVYQKINIPAQHWYGTFKIFLKTINL
jgi:hypothetical protein